MVIEAAATRIALFVPTLGYGGVERVMLHLAEGLAQQGISVDLVTVNGAGEFRDHIPAGVRKIDLRAARAITSLPALTRYLRASKPDAIIAAMTHCSAVALLARAISGASTKVIATEHAPLTRLVSATRAVRVRAMPPVVRWLYPRADAIVAVSEGVARDIEARMGCPPGTVRVIYNPVITPRLLQLSRAPLDDDWFRPGHPPVVLGVGRLEPAKDFATLVRAFALLRQGTHARLVILGEGSQRPSLEALVRELGIAADVRLPGFSANPFPFMRAASVLALSSRWEGLGLVLVEALALGTPVVSTDCPGGPREVLRGGQCGALVPVGDAAALARELQRTLVTRPAAAPEEWLRTFTAETASLRYAELCGCRRLDARLAHS